MDGRARVTFGFPRMHKEPGERRDFLPPLVSMLAGLGCEVYVERGIGSGMGLSDRDYLSAGAVPIDGDEAYGKDVVVVLRAPEGRFEKVRPGATLVSMLHFPTRPARVRRLSELHIAAISMDSIVDDEGRRMVVNSKAVAWNGLEAAFDVLERTWPAIARQDRRPVRVTVMGAGEIGKHAVEASTKYGSLERAAWYGRHEILGVEVVAIGRNLTSGRVYLPRRLPSTDLLVDATQRDDPSTPIIPNEWVGLLPAHAVICDLVVDPYLPDADPAVVRGIEGIPQGDLDRYVFGVDDPAWGELPAAVPTAERRHVVSCYSWPGVHPLACMELYGVQLGPLLQTLAERGGSRGLRPDGSFHERALSRGCLEARLTPTSSRVQRSATVA